MKTAIKKFNNLLLSRDINYIYSRLLQKLSQRTGGRFGKPLAPILALTNRCNAGCVHCLSWKLKSQECEMTTLEWKSTLDELRKWLGPVFISITGGETLLRKDVIEIVEHAAKLGFRVELLTNGFLMTSEKVGQLLQTGVKRITISLDSSKPEIHDKIRGKAGFFDKATKALQMLSNERGLSGRGVEIWGKTVIMSYNVKDLSNLVMFVRKLGINGVLFQSLTPVYYSKQQGNPKWYENNPLWVADKNTLAQSIRQLRVLKTQGYPILNTLENLDIIENYYMHPEQLAYRVHTHNYNKMNKQNCETWVQGLQILPDGGMKMCYRMEPFANVKDGELRKAWKNRAQCWKEPCQFI
jgi:MoaA/NifB/PqqE/SkfB family radical SAM enzyme